MHKEGRRFPYHHWTSVAVLQREALNSVAVCYSVMGLPMQPYHQNPIMFMLPTPMWGVHKLNQKPFAFKRRNRQFTVLFPFSSPLARLFANRGPGDPLTGGPTSFCQWFCLPPRNVLKPNHALWCGLFKPQLATAWRLLLSQFRVSFFFLTSSPSPLLVAIQEERLER